MKEARLLPIATALLGGFLLLHAVMFWQLRGQIRAGYPDFTIFFTAGKILCGGSARELYNSELQYQVQQQFAPDVQSRKAALPFNHPPFEALLFMPLAGLPYFTAYLVWGLVNLLVLAVLPFVLRAQIAFLARAPAYGWFLAALSFFPVFIALLQGQDAILLLLTMSLSFAALKRGSQISAGCWLAFGLFRFHLVLPLVLVLFFKRQWKALAGFAAVALALGLVSVAIVGWRSTLAYPSWLWHLEQTMGRDPSLIAAMPNLRGLLEVLGLGQSLPATERAILAIAALVLIWISSAKWRLDGSEREFDLGFAFVIVVTVVASYHVLPHDLSLLVLPMLLIANHLPELDRGWVRVASLVPIFVLSCSPLLMLLWFRGRHFSLLAPVLLLWIWGIARAIPILRRCKAGARLRLRPSDFRMKPATLKALLVCYLAGVVVVHAALFVHARKYIEKGYPDLAIYYCAGTVVRQGMGHQLYDPEPRFEVEKQFAPYVAQFRGPLPWTHPPFEALVFVPLSYFPWLTAYILWDLFNIGLLATIPFLLRPFLPGLRGISAGLWILAFLAFFPIAYGLLNGQDAILILFLYTLTYVFLRTNRLVASGAALGLALFKFHFVLPFLLVWMLQKREMRERLRLLYGFVSVALLMSLFSVAVSGMRSILAYPRYVLFWEDIMSGPDKVPSRMPSLRGLSYIFLSPAPYVGPLLSVLSLALLIFVVWHCRRFSSEEYSDLNFSLALLMTILVSYHVSSYDLSVLLLPIALLLNHLFSPGSAGCSLSRSEPRRWPRALILAAIGVCFLSPLQVYLSIVSKKYGLMAIVLLVWLLGVAAELNRQRSSGPRLETASTIG